MNLQTINNRTKERGFTIVELLIVIVVIAILAAISIVAYTGVQDRARNSAAEQTARQVANKANAHHAVTGVYPQNVAGFGVHDSQTVQESVLEGIAAETGAAPTTTPWEGDFNAGTLVYYEANDGTEYTIHYRTSSTTSDTITRD